MFKVFYIAKRTFNYVASIVPEVLCLFVLTDSHNTDLPFV